MRRLRILFTVLLFVLCALSLSSCQNSHNIIEAAVFPKIKCLRDPFVLNANDRYYIYGTGWSGFSTASDSLTDEWSSLKNLVQTPADCAGDRWAPEVYEYNGEFYMFASYKSLKTERHGCAVFKSQSPEGPFVPHSNGFVTPPDWDSIDGSLYIDNDGQPWMVFVHEWVSVDDGVGRIACAKMSDDLSTFISEPVELFRADDAVWAKRSVTDGCFVYRCRNGSLIMLWSNWDKNGYCVGMAISESGDIIGPWSQLRKPLISKSDLGDYDGGHAMIFSDNEGSLWLALHSPNESDDGTLERPVFIPIKEENGLLTLDFDSRE